MQNYLILFLIFSTNILHILSWIHIAGVSARGTLTILGITLAALLVTGLIVTFVVFLIRRYRKRQVLQDL